MSFIHPLVFLTGAAVLMIEILGTRVIAPFFGATIYVWSALITVTLAALALGYAAGGTLADRARPLRTLATMLTVAGVSVMAMPFVRAAVLIRAANFGVQWGALVSATALFVIPLFALGTVGPLAVRLRTQGLDRIGREVGWVSSISTIGSVLGALLAGFWLIPIVSVRTVFLGTGVLLLLLAAFCWSRKEAGEEKSVATAIIVLAAMTAGLGARAVPHDDSIVEHVHGIYGDLKVVERNGERTLFVDGIANTEIDIASGESTSDYINALELLPFFHPAAKRALVIGLGGGVLVGRLEQHYGITTDTLDIDPEMERLARRWFNYSPSGESHLEDGRRYLVKNPATYDLIVLDAFNGDQHPYHLFSREAFALIAARMSPGAVLGMNVIGYPRGDQANLMRALGRTLQEVFPHVRLLVANRNLDPTSYANLIFLASMKPIALKRKPSAGRPLMASYWSALGDPFIDIPDGGRLITDDLNPIESLSAPAFLALRTRLIRVRRGILLD